AVSTEFRCERSRKAEYTMFRGRIGRRIRPAIHVEERLDRANIDDSPLGRAQLVEEGMRDVEHTIEIDRQNVVPILGDGCWFARERVAAIDACIIHEDRDVAGFRDLGCHLLASLAVRDIEPHRRCLTPRRGDEPGGVDLYSLAWCTSMTLPSGS